MSDTLARERVRPEVRGGDSFARLLRAEWTKFATVRGWGLGALGATLVIVVVGLLSTASSVRGSVNGFPTDAKGRSVDDNFYWAHQTLDGDGSIVSRVELDGRVEGGNNVVVPWSKAGLIVKNGRQQGSRYAAVMVTGSHGVRFQHDYVDDVAGQADTKAPVWLRLTRSGDQITGYQSADGANWTQIGSVRLTGLPRSAEVGLFATSPQSMTLSDNGGGTFSPAVGTGTFTSTTLSNGWTSGRWAAGQEGGDGNAGSGGSYSQTLSGGWTEKADRITITGAGDIAPVVAGTGTLLTLENFLVGAFAGLIVLIVIGCTYITSEYRTGMIMTTFAASPRRGRVLAAKCLVLGSVAFVVGVVGSLLSIAIGRPRAASIGFPVLDVPFGVAVRVVVGTGLLLAVATLLGLALGVLLRRSATATTLVIVSIVVPYVLALSGVLPTSAGQFLLRVTPAAGFAIQQSTHQYDQVLSTYVPSAGYYPLAPWAGFAVLCLYAVVALAAAAVVLRRRDAR